MRRAFRSEPDVLQWRPDYRGGLISTDGRWLIRRETTGPRAGRFTLIDTTGKQRWSWTTNYGMGHKAYDVDGMWLSVDSAMNSAEEAVRAEGLTSSSTYATLVSNEKE